MALAASSRARLQKLYETSKLFVDLPKLICGKLRSICDAIVSARHLVLPNVSA